MLDILASEQDEAREWLSSHRGADGYADISDGAWDSSLAVINGIRFDRARLEGRAIYPNFVNSTFTDCVFRRLVTDAHFWGAGNRWTGCVFAESSLRSIISPQNVFNSCTFEEVSFDGYLAHETLFESCRFVRCKVVSLRAKTHRRPHWAISEMATLGSSLQFINCKFPYTKFRHCCFGDVAFRNCDFENSVASECDFTGVNSDGRWWRESAQADVFVSFLDQAIGEIIARVGPDASAARKLSEYRQGYAEGNINSKDYTACLYNGSVPNKELDVVEQILDQLGPRFGL